MNTAPVSQAATHAVLDWLMSKRRPMVERDPATGRFALTYSTTFRGMVVVLTIVSSAFLAGGSFIRGDPKGALIYIAIFALLWILSLCAARDAFLVSLSFNEEGIFRETRWGAKEWLPWSAIKKASFSAAMSWFRFTAADGRKLHLSVYRDGLGTFAVQAGRSLPPDPAGQILYLLQQKAANPR